MSSPVQVLRAAIIKALAQLGERGDRPRGTIPIKACYPIYDAHYTCAIALSLSHQFHQSSLEIAHLLAHHIQAQVASKQFTVQIAGQGWLNFRLADQFMAVSLEEFWGQFEESGQRSALSSQLEEEKAESRKLIADSFLKSSFIQYAHARCCALLRLAQSAYQIGDLLESTDHYQWQLLDAEGELLLRSPVEMQLMLLILAIADEIYQHQEQQTLMSPKLAIKQCQNLSINFLQFYDRCQIFGIDKHIALARIGLISTTQKLITFLVANLMDLPRIL